MTSRRLTIHTAPALKLNTTFIGAALTIIGGVLVQIGQGTDNDTFGMTGAVSAVAGFATMAVGSLMSRRRQQKTPDRHATLAAIGSGIALLLIAIALFLTTALTGIAFIVAGIAAALINLSDHIARTHTPHALEDNR